MQRGAWRERVVAIRGDIAESSDDESHSDYQSTGFYTVEAISIGANWGRM